MPIDTEDGTANGLLEVFANPPISLFVKTADTNGASTGSTCKLVLERRPSDICCCSVQTEEDESRFPSTITLGFPDICITLAISRINEVCTS